MRQAKEKELVQKFIKQCTIRGKFETEKPIPKIKVIGEKEIVANSLSNIYSLRADIFITCDDGSYVLVEAKNRINPSALGQLLCYKRAFEKIMGIQRGKIKLVCLYHISDPMIEEIFREFGIGLYKL